MSMRPSRAAASSKTSAARACSRTSARKDTTRPPAAFKKFSACASAASAAASTTATSAPPRANSHAHARPMPDAAPVTSAALPSNSSLMRSVSSSTRLRERRAEPRLVVALLFVGGRGGGDDAVGGGRAPAELDVEHAQLVLAEDREREPFAGTLGGEALVEEVERRAVAVHRHYLVEGREPLLVGGRPRGDVLHRELALLHFERRAEVGQDGRGPPRAVARGVEPQADGRERRVVVKLVAPPHVAPEELFEARARGALGRALEVRGRVVAPALCELLVE